MSATADPNIKQVKITGEAANYVNSEMGALKEEKGDGTRKRGRSGGGGGNSRNNKTLKVGTVEKEGHEGNHSGGGATSPGTLVQLTASHIPGDPKAPQPVGVDSTLTQKGATLQGGAAAATAAAASKVKVILAAPKNKKGAVVLAAASHPKSGGSALSSLATGGAAAAKGKTRKARKIKVSMRGLTKKIGKAKDIRKRASDTTLEQVKKDLQKAGLIKADSKAPETILRQMYADYMTLKSRAL